MQNHQEPPINPFNPKNLFTPMGVPESPNTTPFEFFGYAFLGIGFAVFMSLFLLTLMNDLFDSEWKATQQAYQKDYDDVEEKLQEALGKAEIMELQERCDFLPGRERRPLRRDYEYHLRTDDDTTIKLCTVRGRTTEASFKTNYLAVFEKPHIIGNLIGPNWKLKESRLDLQGITHRENTELVVIRGPEET